MNRMGIDYFRTDEREKYIISFYDEPVEYIIPHLIIELFLLWICVWLLLLGVG